MKNWLRRLGRWLNEYQDPRYRGVPLLLPRVWQGSRVTVTSASQLKSIDLRGTGIDLAAAVKQPYNQMLLRMNMAKSHEYLQVIRKAASVQERPK